MKKIIACIFCLAILSGCFLFAQEDDNISVIVDKKQLEFDNDILLINSNYKKNISEKYIIRDTSKFGLYPKGNYANKKAGNREGLVMPNGVDGESDILQEAVQGQLLYEIEVPTIERKWYMKNDYEHRYSAYKEIFHMVQDYSITTESNPAVLSNLEK